jgi:3-oxoacyl-[acyl-carrier protein] reductase
MDLGLDGRVALVAAASTGLGYAVAERFGREGARLVVCSRSQPRIDEAADRLRATTGAEVLAIQADVSVEADADRLVNAALERFGAVDCLVANAGGPPAGGFSTHGGSLEPYRNAIDLNLLSTVALCQAVVPHMRRRRFGRIAAITSVAARQPEENLLLSSTARAGVLGFLKALSNEIAGDGITVNAVCPGYIKTDRLAELIAGEAKRQNVSADDVEQRWAASIPVGRIGTPAEFADVVVFLASERASYLNGVALPIDGGRVRGLY